MMPRFLYHGHDKKQCYDEACCLVCIVKHVFWLIRFGRRRR